MSVRTQKKPARSEAMSVERKTLYKSRQSVDRKILKNKIWAPKRIRLPSSRKSGIPEGHQGLPSSHESPGSDERVVFSK